MKPYKLTKTIRFKLLGYQNNIPKDFATLVQHLKDETFTGLSELYMKSHTFHTKLQELLYKNQNHNNPDTPLPFKGDIYVKTAWLKLFAKDFYYATIAVNNTEQKEKLINLSKYKELSTIMQEWNERFKIICEKLNVEVINSTEEQYNLNRRASRGLIIRELMARKNFPLILEFTNSILVKKETGNLSIEVKQLAYEMEQLLHLAMKEFLPSQTGGYPLTKASLNYYTIFKNPIDFDRQIEIQKQKLIFIYRKDLVDRLNFIKSFSGRIEQYKKNKDKKSILNDFCMESCAEEIFATLDTKEDLLLGDAPFMNSKKSLRQEFKNIKSKQLIAFNEFIQQRGNFQTLKSSNKLFLFTSITEENFTAYQSLTKEIENKSTTYNTTRNEDDQKKLKTKIADLKKQRGELLNTANKEKSNNSNFKDYKSFCKVYGKIAQAHGRIKAMIKGIEKEKIESLQLKYWALFIEENEQHYIALIPKINNHAQNCKAYLEQLQSRAIGNKVIWFESITFRALRKLCFGNIDNRTNTNTFYPAIKKDFELKKWHLSNGKFIAGEFELYDDAEKINFYKDVLNSGYARKVLHLPFTALKSEVFDITFETLEDFAMALEKVCYQRSVKLEKNILDNFIKNYAAQVFQVSSADLAAHKEREQHTKIWNSFWTAENEAVNYNTRLNPEISITWREAKQSRIDKYGDNPKRNRYLYEQFTLITTISENSNSPVKKLGFIEEDTYKEELDTFNKNTAKDIKFAIGLDNGVVELATLPTSSIGHPKSLKQL
jgi:IS1 family transposase